MKRPLVVRFAFSQQDEAELAASIFYFEPWLASDRWYLQGLTARSWFRSEPRSGCPVASRHPVKVQIKSQCHLILQ
jgi:hypothetical protein